mmetsp:Transcript_38056/g.95702  ORF Transcript_38056/g.95702 Transcript_38056/m.95702 type:complete len:87 (-) Transcript_38056:503-763(-)
MLPASWEYRPDLQLTLILHSLDVAVSRHLKRLRYPVHFLVASFWMTIEPILCVLVAKSSFLYNKMTMLPHKTCLFQWNFLRNFESQ